MNKVLIFGGAGRAISPSAIHEITTAITRGGFNPIIVDRENIIDQITQSLGCPALADVNSIQRSDSYENEIELYIERLNIRKKQTKANKVLAKYLRRIYESRR